MGFLLTFLLTGIVLVGMFYTYRNLAALQISAAHVKAVFAGDHAEFNLATQTNNNKAAYGIAIGKNRIDAELANIPQNGQQIYRINVPTKQRGYMPLGRLRVWCEFPLGLFHVWSWTEIDNNVLVYPKPQNILKHPPEHQDNDGMKASVQFGNDDFAGIRRYIAGDSPKHIAWKALARGHPVMTKQFAALASNEVWLDWYALNSMDDEQKLSQLCQWVLDMHKLGYSYGLKLPNIRIEPSNGEFHKLQCLEQLALFTS